MIKYLAIFFVSMVPLVELRLAMPIAMSMDLPYIPALVVCVLGNMIPVPFIYLFARRFLVWGAERPRLSKICRFFLVKGSQAGEKLVQATGRGGLFVALMLFVGIPIPGTGAWTGALGASFLNMGFKSTVASVSLGVIIAGIIMGAASALGLHFLGL
jgi:uncharacterized membrane protein